MARKRSRRRDEDEDDDAPEPSSDDTGETDAVARRKPRDDAWTGLLAVALAGLIGASVLFYLDHAALSAQQVSPPTFTLPGLATAPAAG